MAGHFGTNLHRVAGLHGLTAGQAAHALGVAPHTYSAWISGSRTPGPRALAAVRLVFEVDPFLMELRPTAEILEDLADPERFIRVEERLAPHRQQLTVLPRPDGSVFVFQGADRSERR